MLHGKLITSFIYAFAFIIAASLIAGAFEHNGFANAAGITPTILTNGFTHSTSTVNTTRSKILSGSSKRQYARIELDPMNATSTVYIYLVNTSGSTSVQALGGIPLSATSTPVFEITTDHLWLGDVWAITATGSPRVHVTTNN